MSYHKTKEGPRMPESEAKKKWMRENTTVITVKFTHNTEQDLLDFLADKPKATTIKQALRMMMETENK